MLEYLEKFNNLPADVKQNVSTGAVMAAIEELEGKYGVDLANFVIRVMVGDLYYKNITANLIIEFNLAPEVAGELAEELQDKVFFEVADFLAAPKKSSTAAPLLANTKLGPVVRRAPVAAEIKAVNPADSAVAESKPANYLEEDKKDIAAMGKIAASLKSVPQEKINVLLSETIKEADIRFASADLLKRFQEILLSYLRGVRTKVEVKENLQKDIASGGVRMTESEADRILGIAQKKLAADQQKNAAGANKVSAQSTAAGTSFAFKDEEIKQALAARSGKTVDLGAIGARDVDYDLSALKNRPVLAKAATEAPAASLAPADAIPVANAGTQDIASMRNESAAGNKQRMEDIRPSPRIMSPIDELAYMDLVNFRRLDPSPAKRIAKIEEKIALLEKEGIDKKIEGIRVWRLNPVSKTYLAMGQESISSGKTIDAITAERKEQGLNYLTQDEFEAVMDLNNNLRF